MGPAKARIYNLERPNEYIDCLFNPTEYTIAKSNSWAPRQVIGKNVPPLEFTGGGSSTMTMELFFDVYEKPGADVRTTHVNKLWKLVLIDEKTRNAQTKKARPPRVRFQWGGQWTFDAVITQLSVKYTLFRQDGIPVRATANVTFQEAKDIEDQPGTNPTSHALPGYKRREVAPRETLPIIAYEEYGNSTQWRLIADANDLEDPAHLSPGTLLSIPPLP